MSVSLELFGLKPPDEQFRKYQAIWKACAAADIKPPGEVEEYFIFSDPEESVIVLSLSDSVRKYWGDMETGIEIDLKNVPEGVTTLRFVYSR